METPRSPVMPPKSCVPYANRPEWADVTPLPVPPGDAGKVVAIQYSDRHAEALAYFRAILAKGEKSQRALELARHLISFNGADYTAWQWRWKCARALGLDLEEERQLTERIALDGAKNYQLWNHRAKIAGAAGPAGAASELAFAAAAIDADAKNYHAWAHRQLVVAARGGAAWAEELGVAEALVDRDVRNNSAWAQRAFVRLAQLQQDIAARQGGAPAPPAAATATTSAGAAAAAPPDPAARAAFLALLPGELEYVAAQLAVAPRNESAWNYLLGLFALPGATPHEMGRHKEVFIICREALADCPSCGPALDALSLYLIAQACLLRDAASDAGPGSEAAAAALARARDAASKALAVVGKLEVADPMRRAYLKHRRGTVAELQAQLCETAAA